VEQRIQWHGAVQDAGLHLAAFDVLALTSWTEGTPITLLEAMSAGVPVVATAVGGVPDVVSSAEAMLCEAGDIMGIASAIGAVLLDQPSARRRAEAARSRLEAHFDFESWIGRHREIYHSLIGAR
jgi:glycosyltransferase involved in cell wall biosynthesis